MRSAAWVELGDSFESMVSPCRPWCCPVVSVAVVIECVARVLMLVGFSGGGAIGIGAVVDVRRLLEPSCCSIAPLAVGALPGVAGSCFQA